MGMTGSIRSGTTAVLLPILLVAIGSMRPIQSFSALPDYNRRISSSLGAMVENNLVSADSNNLDRFRSACLVGTESQNAVDEFDSELCSSLTSEEDDLWVAVYRSNNNKPSVVVRDDFFRAMNDATSGKGFGKTSNSDSKKSSEEQPTMPTASGAATFLSDTMPNMLEVPSTKPVAIARLKKSSASTESKTVYLLDNLRCSLKKENQDASCDGGSEYIEALSVAVDTLILKHLQRLLKEYENNSNIDEEELANNVIFEGTVRTKATLFSGKLFEQRGFAEVETLSRDMATHVSNYEACFQKYADRTIETTMTAGTRDRALQIVALLGRLDAEAQANEVKAISSGSDDDDDDDYDPWANMQLYRS